MSWSGCCKRYIIAHSHLSSVCQMWRWWELRGIGIGILQTKPLVVSIIWRSHEDGDLITGIQGVRTCGWVECPGRWNWFGEHPTRLLPYLLSGIAGTTNTKQSKYFLCFSVYSEWETQSYFLFQSLSSFLCKRSLTWNSWTPAGLCIDMGAHELPEFLHMCIFFCSEKPYHLKIP